MFDPTYQQLIESNFTPIRLKNESEYPQYMGFEQEDISIIALCVTNDKYVIHAATNKYGRLYEQKEIDSQFKFDKMNSLSDLIKFLEKDRTKSQLNLN